MKASQVWFETYRDRCLTNCITRHLKPTSKLQGLNELSYLTRN